MGRRRRTGTAAVALAGTALALAACGTGGADPGAAPAGTIAPPTTTSAGPAVATAATSSARVAVPAGLDAAPFDTSRSLRVPAGASISVLARVPGARFLALTPEGDLLVSQPGAGTVARVPLRPDGTAGEPTPVVGGLYRPHDLVFASLSGRTWLYVSVGDGVVRYLWEGGAPGAREDVLTGLPSERAPELHGAYGHELKNIALSPDGSTLWTSVASTCNACVSDREADRQRAAVWASSPTGEDVRVIATGIRNAEGLAVVPGTDELWVVVNNRDNIAYPRRDGRYGFGAVVPEFVDGHPPEEFTQVREGTELGWPYCNPTPDSPSGLTGMPYEPDALLNPDGRAFDCSRATPVEQGIPAHSAPLGLTFLQDSAVPAPWRTGAAVGLHGSWNRTRPAGYTVAWFPWVTGPDGSGRPGAQQDLVAGWADGGEAAIWGRPVDVAAAPDGSLLVSDDSSGTVYRLVLPG